MDDSAFDERALSRRSVLRGLGALAAGTALGACSSAKGSSGRISTTLGSISGTTTTTGTRAIARPGSLPNPKLPAGTDTMPQIEHIVVLMMENHSYDSYFGMLRRGDGFRLGADGLPLDANPYTKGKLLKSFHMPSTCQLHSHPGQDWNTSHLAFDNGRNDGFARGFSGAVAMGYWDETDLPFYYGLGRTFPLADRWFSSVLAQTYPNRRFLVAGTAGGIISTDNNDLVAPEPPNGTIFERLEQHHISWLNYYNDLPAGVGVIPAIAVKYGAKKIAKASKFITDAAAGTLPAVSFVDPNFTHQSEENPQDVRQGERFAAAVVNAAMHGPAWSKTLLLWFYDEHGGYYDHVAPPRAIKPDNIPPEKHAPGGYDRYGFRVPAVIVSPYARPNYVSHVVHDHTSVLKLIETKWNLPAMTYRDANADNLLDSLDFTSKPAFLHPPTLPAPALPASVEIDPGAAAVDHCTEGEPGGAIPPPAAVVPASEAPKLRIGAT